MSELYLRPHEYVVYSFLADNSPTHFSSIEIAKKTRMDPKTAKKIAEQMANKKIIKRGTIRDKTVYYLE